MRKQAYLLLAFLLLFGATSFAQGLGDIVGTITDPSGAVLAGAKVTVIETGTGLSRTTTADSQGYYVITSLKPAPYTLTIESAGFRTEKQQITLLADQSLTVNGHLQLGAPTEIVEVTGTEVQVDTTTSTLKNVVEQVRLTELPLNGRNAATLTLTAAGAVQGPSGGADQGTTKTFPGAVTLNVNGARQNQISYQLDGGNYIDEYTNVNQPFPNPDALQEFSIQTSNYSAEYGQNAGAVVNVVTKSGTNAFHGTGFEFVRNAVFNARKWDAPLTFNSQPTKDKGRDQLKRNQFGGTFGGPILKDRTFFFTTYQGTRLRNLGNPTTTTVPNAPQRATATDPAVINVLKGIPVGDSANSVTFAKPDHQDFNQLLGKVDHVLAEKDRLSVRYAYDRFKKLAIFDPTNFLTYTDGSTITSQNTLLHETHVFNPHLLNDARFSYSREKASRGPAANAISAAELGVALPYQPVKAIQAIRVNGGFTFGDNPSAAFVRNNFTWSDDVSWIISKHDLHFGGTLERSRVDLDNKFFQPAEFSFSSMANFLAGKLSDPNSGTPAFRQGAGEFKNNRQTYAGLYVQDNIHVNRRLVVNLGVRWEPGRAQREVKNRWTQFRLADLIAGVHSTVFPNAPAGLFFPGDNGFPENGLRDSMNNFAPRVGFALDVFGDSKTSLRGGAGVFYDTRQSGMNNNRMVDSTPFSPQLLLQTTTSALPGTFSDPLCTKPTTSALSAAGCTSQAGNYPFPAALPPPKNAPFRNGDLYVSWDPNHKWQVPTIYNWNLLLERQLPASFLVRAGYVGSHTSHLNETFNQDPCLPSAQAGNGCSSARRRLNALKPAGDVTFGDIQIVPYDINSSYHSLQLTSERRGKSLTIIANYTWSKSIDDLPPGQGLYGFDGTYSARPWDDPLRHAFDRGPSEFDHTHRFVSSFVYQLPGLTATNGFIRNTLGGWQFSGLVSAQTGRPITLLSGSDNSQTGLGQDRPNIVGNAYGAGACATVKTACRDWLSPASFVANPLGTFGNVGKGSLRYPGYYDWDMGLGKTFKFTERVGLQFRAEFFNVFNRVNFDETAVSGTGNFLKRSSGGNFGALRTATDPRIGQLGLKLNF